MISFIEGHVLYVEAGHAVIKTNGIGYHVLLGKKELERVREGEIQSFHIYTHVREDLIELYGFQSRISKQIFLMLISVSGIGPKLGLAMLSALPANSIVLAIRENDIRTLSSIPGIGKKTAERLSLELRDKALKVELDDQTSEFPEQTNVRASLEQALRNLGYSKPQCDKALMTFGQDDFMNMPLEDLIKRTLQVLTGASAS